MRYVPPARRAAWRPAVRNGVTCMSLGNCTAGELLHEIQTGQTTAVDVVRAFLERIERYEPQIKAFLYVDAQAALEQAEIIDRRRRNGCALGRLAGLPVAIKDVLCAKGQPTTCASKMLENFRPPYDATVVSRLKAADAVLIGRTNMDEFAMGASTENSAFFPTRNPWNTQYIPGGSSGGSAACVAARLAPLALGSDTGGSIRSPSALCGVTGLKPSYGRVSRYGLVAFASSLDQVGPITQTAEDAALLLEVIAGYDPLDSTSANLPVPPYSQTVRNPLKQLRLGVVREHYGPGLDGEVEQAVRQAVRVFKSLGATVHEVSLPHSKYAVATYYIVSSCEASSNLARYDGVHYGYRTNVKQMLAELEEKRNALRAARDPAALRELDSALVTMYRRTRSEGFGPEVKRRIMLGTYALSAGYYDAYYKKASKVRRLIRDDYHRAFEQVDVIVGPVTPTPAFKLGEKLDDPLAMYLLDLYTVGANLVGLPGMSIPCGFSSAGLPIGLHLEGPPFAEERLLRAAQMYQTVTDWHQRQPR